MDTNLVIERNVMLIAYSIVAVLVILLSIKNMIRTEREKKVSYTLSDQLVHGASVIIACLLFGILWPLFLTIAIHMQIIRICEDDLLE